MIYRKLGRTGLRVSLASFGTGGPSSFGQAKGMGASEQNALIRRCLDLGVNLFDTSKNYGDSELILGRALRGVPRDSYHIVTKWWGDHDVDLLPDGPEVLRGVRRTQPHAPAYRLRRCDDAPRSAPGPVRPDGRPLPPGAGASQAAGQDPLHRLQREVPRRPRAPDGRDRPRVRSGALGRGYAQVRHTQPVRRQKGPPLGPWSTLWA